ncbi:MAG: polysaccharide deacetylase family protein [Candidatus Rokubacteria bacterium]|nr:polysaccharide deacetylase family protein [Candidatus Rokubacteria bacterium]
MRPATFRARLQSLSDWGFRVLPLDQALRDLERGTLPPRATVITFDDGFYGVRKHALPLLQEFGFPATLYLTTYYCLKETPVFRLAVQYMFWKTNREELDTAGLGWGEGRRVSLRDSEERMRVMWEIITLGETGCDEEDRCRLGKTLGERLGVDYATIVQARGLSLVNAQEIRELAASGISIQLHTHRHRFPGEREAATREIADNAVTVWRMVGEWPQHFSYPDGDRREEQEAWLREVGIRSAVTAEAGVNHGGTPRLTLKRRLDGEHVTPIEFEAEMSGYTELVRRALRWCSGLWRRWAKAAATVSVQLMPRESPVDGTSRVSPRRNRANSASARATRLRRGTP